MHDSSKIQMGATKSSYKKAVTNLNSDPATYVAGLAVRRKSDGLLSVVKADGMWAGVSLGKSLSDDKATAVLRGGSGVPMKLALKRATGTVTITSHANLVSGTDDALAVAGVSFVAQSGAATPGDATFQAATSNDATATSLAAQINAHATVSLKVKAVAVAAVVTLYSVVAGVGGTGTGNDIAVAYTDNDTNVGLTLAGLSSGKLSGGSDTVGDASYATIGSKVYVNDSTGEADVSSLGTISDAVYVGTPKTAVLEDGTESGAAILVDMPGGL